MAQTIDSSKNRFTWGQMILPFTFQEQPLILRGGGSHSTCGSFWLPCVAPRASLSAHYSISMFLWHILLSFRLQPSPLGSRGLSGRLQKGGRHQAPAGPSRLPVCSSTHLSYTFPLPANSDPPLTLCGTQSLSSTGACGLSPRSAPTGSTEPPPCTHTGATVRPLP